MENIYTIINNKNKTWNLKVRTLIEVPSHYTSMKCMEVKKCMREEHFLIYISNLIES